MKARCVFPLFLFKEWNKHWKERTKQKNIVLLEDSTVLCF